jgi:hypothetical protein
MSYLRGARAVLVSFVFAACAPDAAPNEIPNTPRAAEPPSLDLGAVVARVHFAYRPDGDAFGTEHTTYSVRADRAATTFVARHHDGESIATAELRLAVQLPAGEMHVGDDGALVIDRDGVQERYSNTDDGVEQSWRFARAPEREYVVRIATSGLAFDRSTETGLHFVDPESGVGVRYGHATFIDAGGARTEIPATFDDREIVLIVPRDVLRDARYPAVLDPILSPEFGVDNPVAGPASDSQLDPSVARLGTGHFVVWSDRGDIVGTRVDSAGVVLDPYGIVIASAPFDQLDPSISSHGTGALIVWEDTRATGTYRDIWGARIDASGALVDPAGFAIAVAQWEQTDPDVAWNGTEWYVVWSDQRGGSQYDIYGTRVTAAGVVTTPTGTVISNAAQHQTVPVIASNGVDWFVAWEDKRLGFSMPSDIYGTRITAAGTVQNTAGVSVATQARDQLTPSIAALGGSYLVAYIDARSTTIGNAVYGTRIDAAGAVVDATGFPIMGGSGMEYYPAVGSDGTQWLVAYAKWNGFDYDVWATRVSAAAAVLDPAGVAVIAAPGEQLGIDVAFNGGDYLIVEQDARFLATAYHDVYAARLRASDMTALDPSSIRLSTSANRQGPYAVASNGTNYLVVFDDERNGHERDTYAARVGPNGEMRDPAGLAIGTGPGWQQDAAVGSNGDNFLVAFTSHSSGGQPHLYGVTVSAAGVVSPRFTISEGAGYQGSPSIAAVGSEYYVVWTDNHISGTTGIYGSRVSAAGVVTNPGGVVIAELPGYRFGPRIASNGAGYYVVWNDQRTDFQGDIYGTRISAAGAVADPGGVAIAVGPAYASAPRIASLGGEFYTVWLDGRSSPTRFFGTAIDAMGAIARPNGAEITNRGTGAYTFGSNGVSYLLLWNTSPVSVDRDILGTRVYPTGVEDPAGYSMIGDPTRQETGVFLASGIDHRYLLVYGRYVAGAPYLNDRVRGRLLEFDRANGARCGIASECDSTFCVDRRCCNVACGGGAADCQSCAMALGAAADGMCTMIPDGTPCTDGSACTVSDTCSGGACSGTGNPCHLSTTCTNVPPDMFSCGVCPAGTYSMSGTGSSVCMPCPAGQFSAAGATSCTPCEAGRFSAEGAASCTPCSGGSFSASGASSCTPCMAGTFAASGASSCTPCAAGRFSAAGATSCTPCAAGSSSTGGAAMCTPCNPGSFAASGAASCTPCASGTFAATSGAPMCAPCTAGSFAFGTGSTSCMPCAAGRYSASGASACTPCAAGSYSTGGAAMCTQCDAGSYAPSAAMSCTPCLAGTFAGSMASSCTPCGPGSYSAASAAMCTPCAAGSYTSGPASSVCLPCEPGSYASSGASSCSVWSACGAAQYEAMAPSAMNDRECVDCTVCGVGSVEVTPCSATSDTVCESIDPPDGGVDGGMIDPDAGIPDAGIHTDAGMTAVDAGTTNDDAGTAIDDAGTATDDAGTTADAGVFDAGTEPPVDGGCGCRAARRDPIVSLYIALAVAAFWIRRRRR